MRKKLLCLSLATLFASKASAMVGPAAPAPELSSHLVMVLARSAHEAGFCTGTVLTPTKILTAAHCVSAPEDMRVHFRDADNRPVLVEVARVAVHPDFHKEAPVVRERSVDLALVTLRQPLPASFKPTPISDDGNFNLNDRLTLAGFGVTHEGKAASSGQLLKGEVILSPPLSKLLLWMRSPSGIGACTGDSGGPVFARGALVGVISWTEGTKGHHCGALTQAIRIDAQMKWIEDEVAR